MRAQCQPLARPAELPSPLSFHRVFGWPCDATEAVASRQLTIQTCGWEMNRSPSVRGSNGFAKRFRAAFLTGAIAVVSGIGPKPAEGQVVMGWLMGEFLTTETFNVGFDIGMNFSTLTGLENAERHNGTLFGLFGEWRFDPNVHLQVGFIAISGKGANNIDPIPFDDPELDPLVSGGTMDRDMSTLDFPILIQYATGPEKGLRVGAGPQFNVITGAKDRYKGLTSEGTEVVIETDLKKAGRLKGFEAGIAFDVEYQFTPALAIGVRYFQGLTDIDDTPGYTVKSRVLSGSGRIAVGKGKSKAEDEEQ